MFEDVLKILKLLLIFMQWKIDSNFIYHDFVKLTWWTQLDIKKGQTQFVDLQVEMEKVLWK